MTTSPASQQGAPAALLPGPLADIEPLTPAEFREAMWSTIQEPAS